MIQIRAENGMVVTGNTVLYPTLLMFTVEGANLACGQHGGFCTNRYEGCEKGHFLNGLCGGPDYYQCCVVTPVIDIEGEEQSWLIES